MNPGFWTFLTVTKYSAVCLISSEHQDEIVAGIYLIQIAPSLSKKVLNSLMTNAGRWEMKYQN